MSLSRPCIKGPKDTTILHFELRQELMRILLHICCAPCAIASIEVLRKEGHEVTGFFYNPNIHPYSEYLKRKDEVEKYSKEVGLVVHYSDYEIENYFQHIFYGMEFQKKFQPLKISRSYCQRRFSCNEALKDRCPVCWWLRLEKTANFAKENGSDSFTTTLLGSPYQDHDVIKGICIDIAKRLELGFHYKDFRTRFREAHIKAKSEGIYCQNYCGCVFSEKERIDKQKSKLVHRVC